MFKRFCLLCFCLCIPLFVFGETALQQTQTLLSSAQNISSLPQRIAFFSQHFLNTRYLQFPVGEGPTGRYDQQALYRFDVFDCQSYVETVLALALATTPQEFQKTLNAIRYQNAQVDFTKRNHFIGLEWLPNNERQGFFQDITAKFSSNLAIAETLINREAWYQHLLLNRIILPNKHFSQRLAALHKLQHSADHFPNINEKITYIPMQVLLSADQIDRYYPLINSIPSGAIILIIHPNWQLADTIGTNLNVSHMGFAIRAHGYLMFRHASLNSGVVSQVPLVSYLQYYKKNPLYGVAGIAVLMPQQTNTQG